ncbi:MAG: hypothetical protein JW810_14190 [Sedimentisphaerales bacterium]|nr:hypothetical protein [Sedimentisphaerales bacterium]
MDFLAVTKQVTNIVNDTAIVDVHTHLYSEAFGDRLRWGIDELLASHCLAPELLRLRPDLDPKAFFALKKVERAERVWQEIFVSHTPLSEAARGVLTVLHELGVDTGEKDLNVIRRYFQDMSPADYIDKVFELANIRYVVMTNDPFDRAEQGVRKRDGHRDERFRASLRLDGLLGGYAENLAAVRAQGFAMSETLDEKTIQAGRDFLRTWIDLLRPEYLAVALPGDFRSDDGSVCARLLRLCALPVAQECRLPFALMIGKPRQADIAGEVDCPGAGIGEANVGVVVELAAEFTEVKFLVTMLSRRNQHELCVAARTFPNVLPFGCGRVMNFPCIIQEMTAERLEMLGLTYIPQYSDARILDQLIYTWSHSRHVIAAVLASKYFDIMKTGWKVTKEDIARDVQRLLAGGYLADFQGDA